MIAWLADGSRVDCVQPFEAYVIDGDVAGYFTHGVTLAPGDVVVDAGANIGLFARRAYQRCPGVRVVCIEPVPRLRASCRRNAPDAVVLPYALGETPGVVDVEYFPLLPGQSGVHGTIPDDEHWIDHMRQSYGRFARGLPRPLFAFAVRRLRAGRRRIACEVRTLSQIIDEHGLADIALLKLDIEGCELAALRGIREAHWPRIRQVAAEIHERRRDLDEIVALLEGHGLRTTLEEKPCPDVDCLNLWARR